jgi:hypothetical protein
MLDIRSAFGSLAASAYIDQGRSLDFNRPHAHDPTERVPDIDLLVPRVSLERIKPYIDDVQQDCKVFDDFMHARKRRYPVFMASKRAWVGLLDTLRRRFPGAEAPRAAPRE